MTIQQRAAPGSLAQPPPDRDYISYSAINTFRNCPLKYYFKYVLGLPEETVAAGLLFGSSLHASVQHHFEQLLIGRPTPDLDTLLSVFWEEWNARQGQVVQFGKGDDVNTIVRLADRMLRCFQASTYARPDGTILAIEESLRGELVPRLPDLLGRVDLVIERHD